MNANDRFRGLLVLPAFMEALPGHLPGDAASQERFKFCELADTFERQVATLQRQIQNLRRTRDLLLPRLLSGQVELATN